MGNISKHKVQFASFTNLFNINNKSKTKIHIINKLILIFHSRILHFEIKDKNTHCCKICKMNLLFLMKANI